MRIKLPSLSTLIFLFIIYKCVFSGGDDTETNVSQSVKDEKAVHKVAEKTKEVLDKASDLIDEAKEKYIEKKKDPPIVVTKENNNPKNEKLIAEPSNKNKELEKLVVPENKAEEQKPMFKSID